MLDELGQLANQRDVPYQSLIKVFLRERMDMEHGKFSVGISRRVIRRRNAKDRRNSGVFTPCRQEPRSSVGDCHQVGNRQKSWNPSFPTCYNYPRHYEFKKAFCSHSSYPADQRRICLPLPLVRRSVPRRRHFYTAARHFVIPCIPWK